MNIEEDEVFATPEFFDWSGEVLKHADLKDQHADREDFCKMPQSILDRMHFKDKIKLDLSETATYEGILAVLEDIGVLLQAWMEELVKLGNEESATAEEMAAYMYGGLDGPARKRVKRSRNELCNHQCNDAETREKAAALNSRFKALAGEIKTVIWRALANCLPSSLPLEIVAKIWRLMPRKTGVQPPKHWLKLTVNTEPCMKSLEEEVTTVLFGNLAVIHEHLRSGMLLMAQEDNSFWHGHRESDWKNRWPTLLASLEKSKRYLWQVIGTEPHHESLKDPDNQQCLGIAELASEERYSYLVRKVLLPPALPGMESWVDVSYPWTSLEPRIVPVFREGLTTTAAVLWDVIARRRVASVIISNIPLKIGQRYSGFAHVFLTRKSFYVATCRLYKGFCDLTLIRWDLDVTEKTDDVILHMSNAASTTYIRINVNATESDSTFKVLPIREGNLLMLCKEGSNSEERLQVQFTDSAFLHRKTFDAETGEEVESIAIPHKLQAPRIVCSKGNCFILAEQDKRGYDKNAFALRIMNESESTPCLLGEKFYDYHTATFDQNPKSHLVFLTYSSGYCKIFDFDRGETVLSYSGLGHLHTITFADGIVYSRAKEPNAISIKVFDPLRRHPERPVEICCIPAIDDKRSRTAGKYDWAYDHHLNIPLTRKHQHHHSVLLPGMALKDVYLRHRFYPHMNLWRPWAFHHDESPQPNWLWEVHLVLYPGSQDQGPMLTAVLPGALIEVRFGKRPSLEEEAKSLARLKEAEEKWRQFWKAQEDNLALKENVATKANDPESSETDSNDPSTNTSSDEN